MKNTIIKKFVYAWTFLIICACSPNITDTNLSPSEESKDHIKQPNIVWIVAEDLSPYIPPFGDNTIETMALTRLAREGVCYDQFFSPAPVCAPARSAIATGMYPTHIGSNHMRTGSYARFLPEGMQPYEPILPNGVKMMSEILRANGYYCTNNSKEDYQYKKSITAWDESSRTAHWKNRKKGQPFFAVFNLMITHESQIWARANDSLWVDEDLSVDVPPYLPDTDIGRNDVRRMYSNVKVMDYQAGELIKELEDAGLLDETIVFWYSDHGGPLPRQKRLLYDSGIKVPLIVRFPDKREANTRNDDLTSFIDLAPTVLSLAGIKPSQKLDGKAFLGKYTRTDEAKYVFAAGDRFDKQYDKIRAIRDKRYKYIKYYETEKPMFLPVAYREQMPIMRELHRLDSLGQLMDAQKLWFRNTKPDEELFDTQNDPHEIHDISKDPKYADKLAELKEALSKFQEEVPDLNFQNELKYLSDLWPDGSQPVTANPSISDEDGKISIHCTTENVSIGYQYVKSNSDELSQTWHVYTKPFTPKSNGMLKVQAHRVGYLKSEVETVELN